MIPELSPIPSIRQNSISKWRFNFSSTLLLSFSSCLSRFSVRCIPVWRKPLSVDNWYPTTVGKILRPPATTLQLRPRLRLRSPDRKYSSSSFRMSHVRSPSAPHGRQQLRVLSNRKRRTHLKCFCWEKIGDVLDRAPSVVQNKRASSCYRKLGVAAVFTQLSSSRLFLLPF